jgi:hypothetical protein
MFSPNITVGFKAGAGKASASRKQHAAPKKNTSALSLQLSSPGSGGMASMIHSESYGNLSDVSRLTESPGSSIASAGSWAPKARRIADGAPAHDEGEAVQRSPSKALDIPYTRCVACMRCGAGRGCFFAVRCARGRASSRSAVAPSVRQQPRLCPLTACDPLPTLCQLWLSCKPRAPPTLPIPPTASYNKPTNQPPPQPTHRHRHRRREARARLDAAERQGQAFDRQLELLSAVRAYFADQQRARHGAAAAPPPVHQPL